MSRRILCILTALAVILSLAACGDPSAPDGTSAPTSAPTAAPSTADEPSDGFKLTRFIKEFDREPSIGEQELYASDGLTVTAVGIRYDAVIGAVIELRCKNDTQRAVMLGADSSAVNGYMMPVGFDLKVDAGKSADGELTISYRSLALAGLDRVAEVEFMLTMTDPATYEVIGTSGLVTVVTTAAEGYEQPVPEGGQTVYDKGGVRIVLMGLDDSLQFADATLLKVYMCNDSDRDISVQTGEVRVNGYELTSAMTTTVRSGRRAADIVTFFDMDMEEYHIEEIDTVELSFKLLDEATWDVVDQTGLITAEL